MKEEIPEGLQKENLQYISELEKMLPKNYTVDVIGCGWNIKKYVGRFLPMIISSNTWIWWHSKKIEVADKDIYQILKEFGERHEFKKIIKNFV